MMDLCRSLSDYPAVSSKGGGRVAVLTMSGAAGILSSDFIEALGLSVADLSEDSVRALSQVYPDWMPVANPVDLWPAIELNGRKKVYKTAFQAVCTDPGVDAVLFHGFVGGDTFRPDISNLVEMAGRADKPLFGWVMGKRSEAHKLQVQAKKLGLPLFGELYRAVECMAAVLSRRKLPEHSPSGISLTETTSAEENLHKLLTDANGALDEYQSKQILALCDLPVVEEKIVSSSLDAKEIAGEFGFPVVLKGLLPGEIHKTELGLVRTGISSVEEIESVVLELQKKCPVTAAS